MTFTTPAARARNPESVATTKTNVRVPASEPPKCGARERPAASGSHVAAARTRAATAAHAARAERITPRSPSDLRRLSPRARRGRDVLEEDDRQGEGPAGDGPDEKGEERGGEGGDEERGHPELRRAPGQVVVDVVGPEEREVDEAAREAERQEAGEDAHDHVRRQAEDARRVRHGEEEGLPRAEPLPVRSGEADGHQAGHLEGRDRGEDGGRRRRARGFPERSSGGSWRSPRRR